MGSLISSKGKDHALIVHWRNNARSKENQIVKEKKPKSDIEDESSKPIDEGSMKKSQNKGITYKCYFCSKGFHPDKKCFNKNMEIMSHLLDKHNIEVPGELEKLVDSLEHYHNAQFQGDIKYALNDRIK